MADPRIEGIDDELWRAARDKAAYEGRPIKYVLVEFLKLYVKHGFYVIETFKNHQRGKK